MNRIALIAVLLAISWWVGPVKAGVVLHDVIVVASDESDPYHGKAGSEHAGFTIELVREALALEGYQVRYTNMPRNRALAALKAGQVDCIPDGSQQELSAEVQMPLGGRAHKYEFFTLPGNTWQYTGQESLPDVRIGLVDGYFYYDEAFQEYVSSHNNKSHFFRIFGQKPMHQLYSLLKAGRIDTFPAERTRLKAFLAQIGEPFSLRAAGELGVSIEVGLACLVQTPKDLVWMAALRRGVISLKKAGLLQNLQEKYGVTLPSLNQMQDK